MGGPPPLLRLNALTRRGNLNWGAFRCKSPRNWHLRFEGNWTHRLGNVRGFAQPKCNG
jgi:hypothetical protein